MATYEIVSTLPDLDSIEADGFVIKEGFVQFWRKIGSHDQVTIFAVDATRIETIRLTA